MGQQVKSWCRQHERLLIFISFLLLSGLSLYFVYFQENFLRASDFLSSKSGGRPRISN